MDRLSGWDIHAPDLSGRIAGGGHARGRVPLALDERQGCSLPKGHKARNAARGLAAIGFASSLLCTVATGQNRPPDPKAVVIRVGPIEETLEEFSRIFHYEAGTDTTTLTWDRAGVERFLDRHIDTLLLQAWAMRDTTVLAPSDRFMITLGTDRVLKDALRDELLPRYLKADEKELRAVYERMSTQLLLAAIKVPTLVELDSVEAALGRGEPFAEVARRWSRDPTSAFQGGEIGWIEPTRFPVAAQEILWSLPVGSVSPAIAERDFHTLYRALDRRPGPPLRPFEEERTSILAAIYRIELARVGREMHDDLMAAYDYRVDMEAAEWLRAFFEKETASARRTYDPKVDKPYTHLDQEPEPVFWSESPLKGEDAARPIAFVKGGLLTAIEVIDELVFKPTLVWPKFESVNDVIDLCDSALYYRVQIWEARRLGLESRPEVHRKIVDSRRWPLWRAYLRVKILPEITPGEEALRHLYEERAGAYGRPERRRFVLVNVSTRELAEEAAGMLRQGHVPSTIVRSLQGPGISLEVTPDTTSGWVEYGQNPSIDLAIFGLREGEVSEPVSDRGRFSVLRVEKTSPAHTLTFEEVRKGLEREMVAGRQREREARIVEEARPLFEVWIDRNAIGRMEIAPPVGRPRRLPGG